MCCRPDDHDAVELPDAAQAFGSYGPEEPPKATLVPRGQTSEQTFGVAGTYRYVCIPHAEIGMKEDIRVE